MYPKFQYPQFLILNVILQELQVPLPALSKLWAPNLTHFLDLLSNNLLDVDILVALLQRIVIPYPHSHTLQFVINTNFTLFIQKCLTFSLANN